jgi:hypothetical protein
MVRKISPFLAALAAFLIAITTLSSAPALEAAQAAPALIAASPSPEPVAHPRAITTLAARSVVRLATAPRVRVAPKAVHKAVTPKRVSTSLRGVMASAYRGTWYDARFESIRRCIVTRESHGNYRIINWLGYQGAYQFGVSWTRTIQHWTGEHVAIHLMSRYAQDYAWWHAWNHGKGAHHWSHGGYHCGAGT